MTVQEIIEFLKDEINYQTEQTSELHRRAFEHRPKDNEPIEFSHYRYGCCVATRVFCEELIKLIEGDAV